MWYLFLNQTGHRVVNRGFFSPAILKFAYWIKITNSRAFTNAQGIIIIIGEIKWDRLRRKHFLDHLFFAFSSILSILRIFDFQVIAVCHTLAILVTDFERLITRSALNIYHYLNVAFLSRYILCFVAEKSTQIILWPLLNSIYSNTVVVKHLFTHFLVII